MRLASLRHTVSLQAQSGASWSTFATVRALVAPVSGSRGIGDLDRQKVWIQYRNDVLATHRVLFGSRHLYVDDVNNPAERNVELVLYCTERPAADYNRSITLQAAARTEDEGGGGTEVVSTVATVLARIEPLDGNEQLRAMQAGMERPHRFVIAYRSDVTGATRILYDGRTFNVRSVVDRDERHWELVILADEVIVS